MDNRTLGPEEIGNRLRKLRDIRTRTGVAKAVGISPSRLGNYELGYAVPPDDIKVRLANYYGVPVELLFYTIDYQVT